jgi:hypothetical protein
MKRILPFVLFESKAVRLLCGPTKKQEEFLNRYTRGTWSVNPSTGLVDVQGDFDCFDLRLKSFRGISFGHVSGYFGCSGNQLTSLEGAPQTVGGGFHCSNNRLTSLKGAPLTVNGDFLCYNNQLTSLAGAPQTVGGFFKCYDNQLTSLKGAPQTVGDAFSCYDNQLTSLEGAPQTVGGKFYCDLFEIQKGKWNMEGWAEVLNTGTPAAQKLILTLPWLGPDWWNQELQRDPAKTVHLLATVWNHMPKDMQSAIKIPKGYENQLDLFSGFDELGLF